MEKKNITRFIIFILLFLTAIVWIYPILWAIFTSFKSTEEIQSLRYSFFPIHWTMDNYHKILYNNASNPVIKWFINSLICAGGSTLLVLIVASLAAYGYTRIEFKGRDLLFTFLIGSMMYPGIINLIPLYKVMDTLGWVNNLMAIIVPGASSVFNVFLIRQFMLGIPRSFDESARIDGANEFQIFYRIILPNIRPVLTVVALFSFTGTWNDFLWPSVIINDIDKLPITPGLQLLQGQYITYPGLGTAGALISLIPAFLLYLFAKKYFMQSLSLSSGIKE
ncbi:carbohydrate ABC transporter permease [Thermoanaerobacterium thermosaccharolyticum]|uniref:ABC-type sugar transport system, permease component n=1 Tax=Thermoanaerobacterium thermosaccharolyticum M0795 TaxID=698948 RepID=L0IIM5_THETR|nr:carbohydrate ABC transporter permease [Thermoanaerobacterium thermosaccharolyticum]AGB19350.1 ABC-type sugar transport system, permease component [Thermoanaerobacterium thermosaccharolyticum M0795]